MKRIPAAICCALLGASALSLAADGYIESDGTQFINTGYYVKPTSRIELDYALTDAAVENLDTSSVAQMRLLDNNPSNQKDASGSRVNTIAASAYVAGNANSGNHSIAMTVGDRAVDAGFGGIWTSASGSGTKAAYCDATRRTLTIDEPNRRMAISENNAEVWYHSQSGTYAATYTSAWPLGLFGRTTNISGTASDYRSRIRVYGLKIHEGDTLVHRYVPAVKGGEAGLYDTEGDGGFLRNLNFTGANDFAYGGDIREIPDDGYIACTNVSELLWIDSGYTTDGKTRVELDFMQTKDTATTAGADFYLFGTHGNHATPYIAFSGYISKSKNAWGACLKDGSSSTASYPTESSLSEIINHRSTFVLDAKNGKILRLNAGITNVAAKAITPTITDSASAQYPMAIFRSRGATGGTNSKSAAMRIYGMEIYENGELVNSFKPYVQNGVPGLLDTFGALGFKSSNVATNSLKFAVGGLIDSDAASRDAYVESDGTQSIDTGFKPGVTTRIELDFQHLKGFSPSKGQFFISAGNGYSAVYVHSTTNVFMFSASNKTYYQASDTAPDTVRHTAIIDRVAKKFYFITGGVTNKTVTISAATAADANTAKLFSYFDGNQGYCEGRIYSCRFYETADGVETLAHEFVPCVQDGVVGFWDTVGKVFKTTSNGHALTMSGKGVDGAEMWLKSEPAEATVSKDGAGVTLTAAAAGAIRYKWTVNGETIDGATGETCTATWRQGSYDTPDTYACTAIYSVFGVETEGEPHTVCAVTRIAPAFVLTVRYGWGPQEARLDRATMYQRAHALVDWALQNTHERLEAWPV